MVGSALARYGYSSMTKIMRFSLEISVMADKALAKLVYSGKSVRVGSLKDWIADDNSRRFSLLELLIAEKYMVGLSFVN